MPQIAKHSVSLNRVMYILLGVPIGFVLWFLIMLLSYSILGEVNDVIFIASLGICFVIGCFIGDLIGRARNYKGPEQYIL